MELSEVVLDLEASGEREAHAVLVWLHDQSTKKNNQ
jgi:hypothetical protein